MQSESVSTAHRETWLSKGTRTCQTLSTSVAISLDHLRSADCPAVSWGRRVSNKSFSGLQNSLVKLRVCCALNLK